MILVGTARLQWPSTRETNAPIGRHFGSYGDMVFVFRSSVCVLRELWKLWRHDTRSYGDTIREFKSYEVMGTRYASSRHTILVFAHNLDTLRIVPG